MYWARSTMYCARGTSVDKSLLEIIEIIKLILLGMLYILKLYIDLFEFIHINMNTDEIDSTYLN